MSGDAVERRDAVVVGAGPSGAMAALGLARADLSVLLVDRKRFPRPECCGCCLDAAALESLERSGLHRLTERLGAVTLERFQVAGWGRSASLAIPAGAAVSRRRFDAALVRAAQEAGARFVPGCRARLERRRGSPVTVELRRGDRRRAVVADALVVATGLGGEIPGRSVPRRRRSSGDHRDAESQEMLDASGESSHEGSSGATPAAGAGAGGDRIGLAATVPEAPDGYRSGTIYMGLGEGGYAGLVRLEEGELHVAAAIDPERIDDRGPAARVNELLEAAGLSSVEALGSARWLGTPPMNRRGPEPTGDPIFPVGDAAGYSEPLTGEGISWALWSGAEVADFVVRRGGRWSEAEIEDWQRRYLDRLARARAVSRRVAAVARRPWLARIVLRLLGVLPTVGRPVVARLGRTVPASRVPS